MRVDINMQGYRHQPGDYVRISGEGAFLIIKMEDRYGLLELSTGECRKSAKSIEELLDGYRLMHTIAGDRLVLKMER